MQKQLSNLEKFSLKYGISSKKVFFLSQYFGSNPFNFHLKLKKKHNFFVKQHFDLNIINKIKSLITRRLIFFWSIKLYRGIRHKLRLPARGQRTHTNRQTKKKFKF